MLFEAALLSPELVLPASDEAAQIEQPLRMATAAYATDTLDIPASTIWFPRVVGAIEIAQNALSNLGSGGVVALTAAEIVVEDQDGALADIARYGTSDGREVEVRVADVRDRRASDFGTPLRDTAAVWTGRARRVDRVPGRRARIALDDLTSRLLMPLQQTRYTGTGGLEGAAGLADRPKPLALGQCFNVAPVSLGDIDLGDGALPTFQSHWRAVAGHDAIRIRGVARTLVGVAPTSGQARDWPALGMFQLGDAPDGSVTCDVRGDADGYPNTLGAILWRLLTIHGPQLSEDARDSTVWAFAEAALGGTQHFYQGPEDIGTMAAVQRLLAGAGAVLAGDRDGRLRLFDPFTPVADLQFDIMPSDILADPEPIALPDALAPAPREVRVRYGVNNAVIGDAADLIPDDLRQRLTEDTAPVASVASAAITSRVSAQRTLTLPGLYADASGAQQRAEVISAWLAGGGEAWSVTTDRYLGAVNLGDWGRVTYPITGLANGFVGVVIAMREQVDARRVTVVLLGAGG